MSVPTNDSEDYIINGSLNVRGNIFANIDVDNDFYINENGGQVKLKDYVKANSGTSFEIYLVSDEKSQADIIAEITEELKTIGQGVTDARKRIIYFIEKDNGEEDDFFDEFAWNDNTEESGGQKLERIGSSKIDFSDILSDVTFKGNVLFYNTPSVKIDDDTSSAVVLESDFLTHEEDTNSHIKGFAERQFLDKATEDIIFNYGYDSSIITTDGAAGSKVMLCPGAFNGSGHVQYVLIPSRSGTQTNFDVVKLVVLQSDKKETIGDAPKVYSTNSCNWLSDKKPYKWSFENLFIDKTKWTLFTVVKEDLSADTKNSLRTNTIRSDSYENLIGSYYNLEQYKFVPYIELICNQYINNKDALLIHDKLDSCYEKVNTCVTNNKLQIDDISAVKVLNGDMTTMTNETSESVNLTSATSRDAIRYFILLPSLFEKSGQVKKIRIKCDVNESAAHIPIRMAVVLSDTINGFNLDNKVMSKNTSLWVKDGYYTWEYDNLTIDNSKYTGFIAYDADETFVGSLYLCIKDVSNSLLYSQCYVGWNATPLSLSSGKYNVSPYVLIVYNSTETKTVMMLEENTDLVHSTYISNIVQMTQEEYTQLSSKDPNTFYIITQA